jgi:hypothetical protein
MYKHDQFRGKYQSSIKLLLFLAGNNRVKRLDLIQPTISLEMPVPSQGTWR